MKSIEHKKDQVNIDLPQNLGELATLLLLLKYKIIPAWKIAQELGYKLRAIRYHIKDLKERKLIEVQHRITSRGQQANCYRSSAFAPLTHTDLSLYIDIYRALLMGNRSRGAKRRIFLLMRILQLLEEISKRLGAESLELLHASWRYLRHKRGGLYSVMGVLEGVKELLWGRGKFQPRNPQGYFIALIL